MDSGVMVIIGLIFVVVLLAARGITTIVAGKPQRLLRARLATVRRQALNGVSSDSLIRERYLRALTPLEQRLEQLPGMRRLTRLLEQTGEPGPGYRLAAHAVILALPAGAIAGMITGRFLVALAVLIAVLPLPALRVIAKRRKRIQSFEQQLPDALDLMSRALRAGMPLMEAFRFVAEELPPPISDEFRTTWSHLNYGISPKDSFDDLSQRMPCTSLSAMTTAVQIQRETGGNLAEIVDKIATVLRARFRFQRRLKTLTAEGRMSAWVLILLPFVLSGVLGITSPSYLPMLFNDALGVPMVSSALVMITIGVIWIRKIVRIDV